MTASKRKNDGVNNIVNNFSTKLVIVGNNNNKENQWEATAATTMDRMKQFRDQWKQQQQQRGPVFGRSNSIDNREIETNDLIAEAIRSESVYEYLREPETALVARARQIQMQLLREIEQAKERCDQESIELAQLASQLATFQQQRKQRLEEIEDLDDRQRAAQKMIALHQEEVSQDLDVVNDLEEEKKRQVPRLKAAISLYAVTTGIKWDFADPDILTGQVDIPSKRGFKLFSIDPRDYSPVETADKLWDMMEGKTDALRQH